MPRRREPGFGGLDRPKGDASSPLLQGLVGYSDYHQLASDAPGGEPGRGRRDSAGCFYGPSVYARGAA